MTTEDDYPDNGCDVAPKCVNCVLPQCKYDNWPAYYAWRRRDFDPEVEAWTRQGLRPAEIAAKMGRPLRSVERALQRIRDRATEEAA